MEKTRQQTDGEIKERRGQRHNNFDQMLEVVYFDWKLLILVGEAVTWMMVSIQYSDLLLNQTLIQLLLCDDFSPKERKKLKW